MVETQTNKDLGIDGFLQSQEHKEKQLVSVCQDTLTYRPTSDICVGAEHLR